MRRLAKIFLIFILIFQISGLTCWSAPMEWPLAAGFLFEIGLDYYNRGKYSDALHELGKVLIIQPTHKEAIRYIKLIQVKRQPPPLKEEISLLPELSREEFIEQTLEQCKIKFQPPISEVVPAKVPAQVKVIPSELEVIPVVVPSEVPAQVEVVSTGIEFEVVPALIPPKLPVQVEVIPSELEAIPVTVPSEVPLQVEVVPSEEVIPEVLPSEAEISPEIVIPSVPPAMVGQIRLFVNNQQVGLENPLLIKDERVFVPLLDIAKGLNYSVINLEEGRFRLISPEGLSQEVEATFIEGIPVVTPEQVNEYFSVKSNYDASKKALFVWSKSLPKFKTYLVKSKKEKPGELEERLKQEELLLEEKEPGPPKYIPEAARPYIELRGSNAYLYRDYHLQSTYHSDSLSLWGRVYDYNLKYESHWKDIAGKFDHDYHYLNLYKEDFWISLFDQSTNLNPLRGQSESFKGLKVAKTWSQSPYNKTSFLLGDDIDNYISGTGGSVKYIGQIFGVEHEYKPWEWMWLKGVMLYRENYEAQPDSLSGTTSFPRRNLIYFMDNSIKLRDNLSFFTQLAQCNYNPDNEPDKIMDDWNWRIGSEWLYPRGRMKFVYEFVGDEYASLGNPLTYQDYEGWQFYTNYKVTDRWRLSGSLRRYQNNVDEAPDKITTENQALSLHSSYRIFKNQSVGLSFSRFNSNPSGPGAGSGSQTNLYRIDYFLPFLFDTRLLLNYQYSTYDVINDSSDYSSYSPGISLYRSFGRGSSWYVRQGFRKTLYREEADILNSSSSFNLNYMLNPRFSVNFGSVYTHNKTKGAKTTENLTGSINFRYQLSPKRNLNLEYAVHSYDPNTEDNWPHNWSIMLYLRQNFDISSRLNFGKLNGRVILDLNANDRFDLNEPGIEGASLSLDDGRKARTDQDGYFSFAYVCPGINKVYLDLEDLPLEWTSKELEKEIEVKPRKEVELNFLLVKSASIQGRVFIDANNDLLFQDNEEPLEGINVLLLPQEQFRSTNQDGIFKFDYLLPGRYTIKVYSQGLPKGLRVISPEKRETELSSGDEVKDLGFPLQWEFPIEKF